MKKYNTPHRRRVIKTRLTEEEYAEFSERVTLCKMSQAEFIRQALIKSSMLALEDKLQNMPNNLSGGQQQRVAIARALITKPAIILADEPTGNLDSKTSADVLGLLKHTSMEFNQTIVMITHNNEIAQLADRIVRIEDGRIVGGGRQARRDLGKLSDEMLPASHKLRSDS